MTKTLAKYQIKSQELFYIISRNVFLFTNGLITLVIILLFVFGDTKSAIFLGIIFLVNIFFGLVQDFNAWVELAKLQSLTAPRVNRLKADKTEESVLTEEIKKGDQLKLKIGDQVPCDSILLESHNLEINDGLITGESDSLTKVVNDHLLAGSVVTAGVGIIQTEAVFHESRIARMTQGIKKYTIKFSPIQKAINLVIKKSGYVLAGVIVFVLIRAWIVHEPAIRIIKNVGALTSALVPVGLFFAVTLFFAYGAAHLFRRHVLLQEVNATEKLGRIKNLCLDKTGTLTENIPVVENIFIPPGADMALAKYLTSAYITGSGDNSQTILAVKKFVDQRYTGEVTASLSFSSWRKYGAVCLEGQKLIFGGAPDIFLPHITNREHKKWLQSFLDEQAEVGKRVWCLVEASGKEIPADLVGVDFSVMAVYVFYNNLREGIKETISFFQNRGINIRIISGDNPRTVRAVARLAGVANTDKIITGQELEAWTKADYENQAKQYSIFARIVPEQKEKIIDALRLDGFTAMVGDGANDALAIKKADLGIAMFDGAKAVRQLAAIVLTNNSFTALPGGVALADSIIRNVEIFASIFINLSFVNFFIFLGVSLFGYDFPLTPLNISLINYFTVGFPGMLISYWTIMARNTTEPLSHKPFLKKILPFVNYSAILQALFIIGIFFLGPESARLAESNILVVLASIVAGFIFFIFTPYVYRGLVTRAQKIQILGLGMVEIVLVWLTLKIPYVTTFFDTTNKVPAFSPVSAIIILGLFCLLVYLQYLLAKYFAEKKIA